MSNVGNAMQDVIDALDERAGKVSRRQVKGCLSLIVSLVLIAACCGLGWFAFRATGVSVFTPCSEQVDTFKKELLTATKVYGEGLTESADNADYASSHGKVVVAQGLLKKVTPPTCAPEAVTLYNYQVEAMSAVEQATAAAMTGNLDVANAHMEIGLAAQRNAGTALDMLNEKYP